MYRSNYWLKEEWFLMFNVVYFRNGFVTPWHTLKIPEIATQECLYCHFIRRNHMLPFSSYICCFFQRVHIGQIFCLFFHPELILSLQMPLATLMTEMAQAVNSTRFNLTEVLERMQRAIERTLQAVEQVRLSFLHSSLSFVCDRKPETGVWRGELPYLCARIDAFLQKTIPICHHPSLM